MKKIQMMVAAIALFHAGAGLAGNADIVPVLIDLETNSAQGAQSSARYSDSDVENIGCGATVTDSGNGNVLYFGFCQATDANGESAFCATFSPDLVGAINAIANYGFIRFTWNDAEECVSIRNSTQSIYLPELNSEKSKKSKKPKE